MQEQRKPDRAAEEFGEVRRHRGDLADDPQRPHDRPREMGAAHFREITARDDAKLGRQPLEQHRGDICQQHDPEQRITISRAGLDVGREVARIHIGD